MTQYPAITQADLYKDSNDPGLESTIHRKMIMNRRGAVINMVGKYLARH